jgi:hypothetical protein
MYLSMAAPPFEAGAVMATVAEVGVTPVTDATVGAPGGDAQIANKVVSAVAV